uniref:Replication protein n=1 Tax=viral metagenome TaxID=1070528 RepID=A0A6M3Y4H9_9ZZZZ
MGEQDWFFDWEKASRDTIDVKRCYIDIAGDLVAGILLSQIIYWFLPGKSNTKLHIERDGIMWLAKGRSDWWDECRITTKQFDRAATVLRDEGLIMTGLYRFRGSPTVHITLCLDTLVERVKSKLTKGENPIRQDSEIQIDETVKSLHTEITTKTTTESGRHHESFEDYKAKLRTRFANLDFDTELEKFNLYWSEGKRKLKNPKLALLNWMTKAEEFRKERGNGAHRGDNQEDRSARRAASIGAPLTRTRV